MLLEVKDVFADYGLIPALQGMSLSVDQGEVVALLGRNGMGKSTTLKAVMGLVPPKTGRVCFKGREIAGLPAFEALRVGIAYVPEERRIFSGLSVLENLTLGMRKSRSGGPGKKWTLERIYHHFPFMKDRSAQKGAHLSGGEQQMLAIARALMSNPDLLLIDEPTEGLAPLMVREVSAILSEINADGVAVLLVEHNLNLALSLSRRVYLMEKGRVGYCGSADEIRGTPDILEKYLAV